MSDSTKTRRQSPACACPDMYTYDLERINEHCRRWFLPTNWHYAYTPPVSRPSLVLKGRCLACGGSIQIGRPLPECRADAGARYSALLRLLQIWRPYAAQGPEEQFPATANRTAWYHTQEARSCADWVALLLSLLPEEERRDARLWADGWLSRIEGQLAEAWPIGRTARFLAAGVIRVSPFPDSTETREIPVRPWQELLVTSRRQEGAGIRYSGLIRQGRERFYVESVPYGLLYTPAQWAALLPELLETRAPVLYQRDFPPADYPQDPERLYALVCLEDGAARTLAVSPSPELLKEAISRDIGRQAAQGVLPIYPDTQDWEKETPGQEAYCCRRLVFGERTLEYQITAAPYLSAEVWAGRMDNGTEEGK